MSDSEKQIGSCYVAGTEREDSEEQQPPQCPRCGAGEVRMILYGYIKDEVDHTKYVLGGCVVTDEHWSCGRCLFRW